MNKIFKKEGLKPQRGITLIALVITIIVLLILAGVSLSLVTGSNGILGKASSAVDKTNQAQLEEEVELAMAELQTEAYQDVYVDGTSDSVEDYIKSKLKSGNVKTTSGKTISVTDAGLLTCEGEAIGTYNFETGVSKIGEKDPNSQSYNAIHPEKHIPTGFGYKEGTVETGYVITDSEGNEFVWIPVASSEAYRKKLGKNNWYLKEGTTDWSNQPASSFANISEAVQGDKLGTGSILGTTVASGLDANTPEYEVVASAGGFWVGRYEAGTTSTTSETTTTWAEENAKNRIVVKEGVQPARQIYQTQALNIANSWKSGEEDSTKGTVAFQSGLITGAQWDAMCKFIGWSVADATCTNWGNYRDALFTTAYTGYHSSSATNDWNNTSITRPSVSDDYRYVFPTGRFVNENGGKTVKKNIYDVAGNVWEWTTEVPCYSPNNGVLRGGSASGDGSYNLATNRNGDGSATTSAHWHIGFRLVLYVK